MTDGSRRSWRAASCGFGLVLCAGVLLPLGWSASDDSFPFSPYTMFSTRKGEVSVYSAVAMASPDAREVRRIAPELVVDREVMLAVATVRRAASAGPEAVSALCGAVASRLAVDPEFDGERYVGVVVERLEPIAWARGDVEGGSRRVIGHCEIER